MKARNALVDYTIYVVAVREAAYFKWLAGSENTELNWYEAVSETASRFHIKTTVDPIDIPRMLTEALVKSQLVLK